MEKRKHLIEYYVRNLLKQEDFDLVDISIKGNASSMFIQFFVDCDGGISLKDCVYLNRKISELFEIKSEEFNIGNYRLEVSSPGIERPIKNESDFRKNINRQVLISFNKNGKKDSVKGRIIKTDSESVIINVEGDHMKIPYAIIESAIIQLNW